MLRPTYDDTCIQPESCPNCEIGIHARTEQFPGMNCYCNNINAAIANCHQNGSLIFDRDILQEHYASLELPQSDGKWIYKVEQGKFILNNTDTDGGIEKYRLFVANCNNTNGRNLYVSGEYIVKSAHGYLPWNLFGKMYFFSALTFCYLALVLWYRMKMGRHSNNGENLIHKLMLVSITIGLLDSFFELADLWLWNMTGERNEFCLYTALIMGGIKAASSRCLFIMLCKGWGVDWGTLRDRIFVTAFGTIYLGIRITWDVLTASGHGAFRFMIISILFFIDLIFSLWSCCTLGCCYYCNCCASDRTAQNYALSLVIVLVPLIYILALIIPDGIEKGLEIDAINATIYLFVFICIARTWALEIQIEEYDPVIELSGLPQEAAATVDSGGSSLGLESQPAKNAPEIS